ncbi:hypothetical protein [Streptomyces sp. NEAU-YJ-81]|uniref:hypothetical protein n=1 Tax=Streptomyces sp. NEAU-YJ-81 TaxID=2820288 RepID=UPI001ABBFB64|nr:hypothetical protein [Streptomyces sp. NEAU-YJ-81]MBO3677232.1 hypothetical protein [Streptomyces sp. NEAU-YJ-81]
MPRLRRGDDLGPGFLEAAVGVKREDPEQVVAYTREALHLAREFSSGYVAHRLQALRSEFGPLARERRIADLDAEIKALSVM